MSQAVEVAKSAIADIQQPPEQDTVPGSGEKDQEKEPEGEEEEEERRKAALDKLEKAGEDSILGQASTCLATLSILLAFLGLVMPVIMVSELLFTMCVCVCGFLQGLKAFDSSVETITTGTWQALGTAWRSGSLFVQKYTPSPSVSAVTARGGNELLILHYKI